MKKVLLLVIVAGILMLGVFSAVDELSEGRSQECIISIDENVEKNYDSAIPCEGGGDGGGDVPG